MNAINKKPSSLINLNDDGFLFIALSLSKRKPPIPYVLNAFNL